MHKNNLCLWNNDSPTYLHPATGSLTAIDLTTCSPHLFLDFSCSVRDDQWGSEHYRLIFSNHFCAPDERVRTWQFQKAGWDQFQLLCQNNLTEVFLESNDPLQAFSENLFEIMADCIPKGKPNSNLKDSSWFTEDCKIAVRARRGAWEQPPRGAPGYQVLSDILFRLGLIANWSHTVQYLDCSDLNRRCNHYHLFWHCMTLLVLMCR